MQLLAVDSTGIEMGDDWNWGWPLFLTFSVTKHMIGIDWAHMIWVCAHVGDLHTNYVVMDISGHKPPLLPSLCVFLIVFCTPDVAMGHCQLKLPRSWHKFEASILMW